MSYSARIAERLKIRGTRSDEFPPVLHERPSLNGGLFPDNFVCLVQHEETFLARMELRRVVPHDILAARKAD